MIPEYLVNKDLEKKTVEFWSDNIQEDLKDGEWRHATW
jgi:hypothetical protein